MTAPKTAELGSGDIASWTRERSEEEIHSFLGGKMAALALEYADIEDDEEVGLYDLATV